MPRRKPVLTLTQCCYQRIARSFDKFWMKDFDAHFKDMPRLLYAIGPFEDLTNEMVQCLINSLVEDQCLHRRHFKLLMQESIARLDLSHAKTANCDAVIHCVATRCPKLVSLNLCGMRNVSGRALSDLVERRPSLKVLNLSKTNCNDQVLSILGHHALGLLDLDVSSTSIMNSGLFSLCQAFDKDSTLGCKKLVKLNILGTAVNKMGALHCLQNLPKLQYLGFEDVCGIIEMDVLEGSGVHETYNLRSLCLNGLKVFPGTDSSIDLSCKMCPEAVEVKLQIDRLPDKRIGAVGTLKHLERLEIGQNDSDGLTFEHGILPVLSNIGDQLTELSLFDIADTNLIDIAQKCRNIQKLSLAMSNFFGQDRASISRLSAQDRCTAFSKLQHFTMICSFEEGPMDIFRIMLANAKHLKSLEIHFMPMLSTDLMLDVLKENPMKELQKVGFYLCNNIGPSFVDALLSSSNELSEIELRDCKDIHRRDYERFLSIVETCSFDLKIHWS